MQASAISRVLGQTYRKSTTHSTRISGWSNTHEGYIARQLGDAVLVTYELGDWNRTPGLERVSATTAKLAAIAATLTRKGYSLTFTADAVLVTEKVAA